MKNLFKIGFRPEIEGLRAIAVTVVILYHTQISIFGYQFLKGGFIGVDIFFVISGYLITSIILKELTIKKNSFDFINFYKRRIIRILPSLLLVMVMSLPFAWFYLTPNHFLDFSKSIFHSLGFSSNFYFWATGQKYNAASEMLRPFLHTWSLSVEVQYYILFSIILFIVFKYYKRYLIYILTIGFIVSLSLADWGSRNYQHLTFYVLPTRVWELLVGSILAYFEVTLDYKRKKKIYLIFPSIGLVLILHSLIFFSDKMFHPSFYTLSPIIGASLIIWFSNKNEPITMMLSSKLFVGVGLISYSLYLWHYPILSFSRIMNFNQEIEIGNKLILIIIIFILSIISYNIVEKPLRKKNFTLTSIFILSFSLLLITINLAVVFKNGFSSRFAKILQDQGNLDQMNLLKNEINESCFDNKKNCIFNSSSNKKVFVIGDSHMEAIIFDLKNKLIKKNYYLFTSIKASCYYFPGFELVEKKNNKISKICNNAHYKTLNAILNEQTDSTIIFGGRLSLYLTNNLYVNNNNNDLALSWVNKYVGSGKFESLQSSFKNTVEQLSKKNKIILIYPIPEIGILHLDQVLRKILKKDLRESNRHIEDNLSKIEISYESYKERNKLSFELLDSIKGTNIYRVYPHKLFCNTFIENKCVIYGDNKVFYFDDNHVTKNGAIMINNLIIKELEHKIFK